MMTILPRRGFLLGLAASICAPAIVRATSLMPVKSLWVPWGEIEIENWLGFDQRRTDLDLFNVIKELALEHTLRIDGAAVFKTTPAYSQDDQGQLYPSAQLRHCAVKLSGLQARSESQVQKILDEFRMPRT
jgi:hypothetical protein